MSMHRTILEEVAEQRLKNPAWEYANPFDLQLRCIKPRWRWMVRVCREIPQGKCVLFPVPEGEDANEFARALRLSVAISPQANRYSIRRTKCLRYVAVLKAEMWKDYYARLETYPASEETKIRYGRVN